jgi:hypothetical protein
MNLIIYLLNLNEMGNCSFKEHITGMSMWRKLPEEEKIMNTAEEKRGVSKFFL